MGRIREELSAGQKDAQIKTFGDAILRSGLLALAIVIACFSPLAIWGKLLVFLGVSFAIAILVELLLKGRPGQIGWHMLSPPTDPTGVRPDLPLGQWKLSQQEFKNRDGCMQHREAYLAALSKELDEKINDSTWVAEHVKQIADHTECIRTDDPRFPGDFHRWWSERSR